jgi:hypothetical protein
MLGTMYKSGRGTNEQQQANNLAGAEWQKSIGCVAQVIPFS